MLGDYVHISSNAALGGTVHVGNRTGIGTGVRDNIDICKNCMIEVGAAVVNNLNEQNVYLGVPTKLVGG